jgi:hypothetical protein
MHLATYAAVGCCFAAALWWLLQPRVIENTGLATYKPPPGTMLTSGGSPGPAILPPLPDATSVATAPDPQVAPQIAEGSVVAAPKPAAKRETKRREAVTNPRPRRSVPEQRDPQAAYAYQPSYGFRPWF